MLIYNVTSGVDKKIELEWLLWMKETHIPEVMRTGMFVDYTFYKILSSEQEDSISYAVQYSAISLDQVEKYLENYAPTLREEVQKKFGEGVASFRTLLEEV
jgi:Domain of unknown function (DUF4286)